jgi:RNA polymerase sigma-70 factor (ECF subfamily)
MDDTRPEQPSGERADPLVRASKSDLADAFCAARAGGASLSKERRDAIGELLAARISQAIAAHPQLEAHDARQFAAHLAGQIDPRDDALAELELIRSPQLWLAWACAQGDARAIELLESTELSRMPAFIARVDRSPAFIDEVLQQLRDHLLVRRGTRPPGIADYAGRGELGGWLRVLALRMAQRHRRAQRRESGASSDGEAAGEVELLGPADPERDYLKLRYQRDYEEAFKAALGALSVRERLQLSDSEFESVLGLVRSQLAISFRSAFGE